MPLLSVPVPGIPLDAYEKGRYNSIMLHLKQSCKSLRVDNDGDAWRRDEKVWLEVLRQLYAGRAFVRRMYERELISSGNQRRMWQANEAVKKMCKENAICRLCDLPKRYTRFFAAKTEADLLEKVLRSITHLQRDMKMTENAIFDRVGRLRRMSAAAVGGK